MEKQFLKNNTPNQFPPGGSSLGTKDFGVLYVIDDNPGYEKMLEVSIQSLDDFHPDWPRQVVRIPLPREPFRDRLRRMGPIWKWRQRYNRLGQDKRFYRAKAMAAINSPFENTLFLDVDTVIRKPLDTMRKKALQCDALFTGLPWKHYPPIEADLPREIPYVMSGVFFYNQQYAGLCRPYLERFAHRLHEQVNGVTIGDQFVFSLVCTMESRRLNIQFDPHLQVDVVNARQHLGANDLKMIGKCLDLSWEAIDRFFVFHYNEYKPQYLQQIKKHWGYPQNHVKGDEN